MKISSITNHAEYQIAERRLKTIQSEIDDLQSEVATLESEVWEVERSMRNFKEWNPNEALNALLKLVREQWQRFTNRESRIIERAADGQYLNPEEEQRLKLCAFRELHTIEL